MEKLRMKILGFFYVFSALFMSLPCCLLLSG